MEKRYVTVSALNRYLKAKFLQDEQLSHIYIKGEVSNLKYHASGHLYFTLKDQNSRVSAVMFASAARKLKFRLEDGMHVFIEGNVSVYEVSGQYQIYAQNILMDGIGQLYVQFEQLKKKLHSKGFFDETYKKPLPLYPKRIGIITGENTAALRDILKVIRLRYPMMDVSIIPALVQGSAAADSIVKALKKADNLEFDAILLARGGGSIEDLWPFNEEEVAIAIFEMKTPIVSAIGHESDVVISDYVADARAATPTAGASMIVPDRSQLLKSLINYKQQLAYLMQQLVKGHKTKLETLSNHYLLINPMALYQEETLSLHMHVEKLQYVMQQRLDYERVRLDKTSKDMKHSLNVYTIESNHLIQKYRNNLRNLMKLSLINYQHQFDNLSKRIDAFSPLGVLKRGYTYVEKDKVMIKSSKDLTQNDEIDIIFHDGKVNAVIKGR